MLPVRGLLICAPDGRVAACEPGTRDALAASGGIDAEGRCTALVGTSAGDGAPPSVLSHERWQLETAPATCAGEPAILVACRDAGADVPGSSGLDAARYAIVSGYYEGIVHDLRSPLNSIAMNAEMLRYSDDPERDADAQRKRRQRYTEAIGAEVQRLSRGVATLVEFLSLARSDPSTTSIAWLAERTRTFAAPALRGWQSDLKPDGSALDEPVTGDVGELELAFLAALLLIDPAARPGEAVRLGAERDGGAVVARFEANGEGDAPRVADANLAVMAARLVAANGGALETGRWGVAELALRLPVDGGA